MSEVVLKLESKFWEKVSMPVIATDCWNWQATKSSNGYGLFWINDKNKRAHRVAYEAIFGSIPEELECHHICENKRCVNPFHIKLVTPIEHLELTPTHYSKQQKSRVCCMQGHAFTQQNTYVCTNGARVCRICHREELRLYRLRRKEKIDKVKEEIEL